MAGHDQGLLTQRRSATHAMWRCQLSMWARRTVGDGMYHDETSVSSPPISSHTGMASSGTGGS